MVQELERRGWRNKSWTTRSGQARGGEPLTRTNLHRLLTNPIYAGKVRHKGEVFPGEHPAVIDDDSWRRVQARLAANGRGGGGCPSRDRFGALLKGLLFCAPAAAP